MPDDGAEKPVGEILTTRTMIQFLHPEYIIERHKHGWLIRAADGMTGVPFNALSEATKLFPKKAVIHLGIAHHFGAVFAVGTKTGCAAWVEEIEAAIAGLPAELRWFRGTDTGLSAMTIYAALARRDSGSTADALTQVRDGYVPADVSDFGRCKRLLQRFPEWRSKLGQVAEAFPKSKWRALVGHWDKLESLPDAEVTAALDVIYAAVEKAV